ncbi:hypothetical protein [Jeotgalibaca caeni]|jgi:hypothetical protein|uniref:hypothetical protein n=1 Tax=Jeotgalibaca caeni TaxID=3028623 RepID=UPI00237E6E35|nr:hypothetical protein [Jeotgalibaca caeni]MDE1548519.1 hypothetical protein [Jeotgalibaca caeni]
MKKHALLLTVFFSFFLIIFSTPVFADELINLNADEIILGPDPQVIDEFAIDLHDGSILDGNIQPYAIGIDVINCKVVASYDSNGLDIYTELYPTGLTSPKFYEMTGQTKVYVTSPYTGPQYAYSLAQRTTSTRIIAKYIETELKFNSGYKIQITSSGTVYGGNIVGGGGSFSRTISNVVIP